MAMILVKCSVIPYTTAECSPDQGSASTAISRRPNVDHFARENTHAQANTPSGKVLFQYDHFQSLADNSHNP